MGGMAALEWPLCSPPGFVKMIIPIATSAYQSAWGIAWNNAQIRCIQADPKYKEGRYDPVPSGQPAEGLGAARLIAMLTYRSHPSFESRFSRRSSVEKTKSISVSDMDTGLPTPANSESGCQIIDSPRTKLSFSPEYRIESRFAAQSYMQYQADKFLKRFDANCYVHMVEKMDSHDITDGRTSSRPATAEPEPYPGEVRHVLSQCPPHALVVSIESDVLFTATQQNQLAEYLPDATLVSLPSSDGHDGFLLEFESLGGLIMTHLKKHFPQFYMGETLGVGSNDSFRVDIDSSVFGEADPNF